MVDKVPRGLSLGGVGKASSHQGFSYVPTSMSEARSMAAAPTMPAEFSVRREGWLLKNHHGGSFSKNKKKRWFLSDGFHVEYWETAQRKKRAGKFDLRNVVGLRPSIDADVPHGLDFELCFCGQWNDL